MTPARKAPSDLPGAQAQAAGHEPRRVAWTPEANQISDRTGVAGSRSTSITFDIGELDSPGPDRGKRGAMRREPLTGNTGEDLEPHKPVHETPTVSCTGKTGHEGSPFEFVADESRMSVIYTTA